MGFVQVNETVRVESRPATYVAVATEVLLGDAMTASHYKVGGLDAVGQPIVLGAPFTYHDWLGGRVWAVYELVAEEGEAGTYERYVEVAFRSSEAEAIAFAETIGA